MTEHETEISPESAEQILEAAREEARQEARDVYDDEVVEADGEEWTVRSMMDRFEISRRTAIGAMGLLLVGSVTDPVEAVMRSYVGTAEAQSKDLTIPGTINANAVSTEQMGSERHYAGSYGGGDADARLDNAISAAGDGHTIYLEQATYSDDRSISTSLSFIGPSATAVAGGLGSKVSGTWTFSASCVTDQVRFTGGVTADADSCGVLNGLHTGTAAFEVNGDDFRYIGNINGAVTFANGTQGGIVDACTGTSYTDNDGRNKQGDIA